MAQAVPTTTQAPPAATTEAPAIVFTFEEQVYGTFGSLRINGLTVA